MSGITDFQLRLLTRGAAVFAAPLILLKIGKLSPEQEMPNHVVCCEKHRYIGP